MRLNVELREVEELAKTGVVFVRVRAKTLGNLIRQCRKLDLELSWSRKLSLRCKIACRKARMIARRASRIADQLEGDEAD